MKGYAKLNECEKGIVDKFEKDFLKVNDSRVEFISVLRKSGYLRVDLLINGRVEWLHVNPYGWY